LNAEVESRFDWGRRVRAAEDLYNDGSYPEQPIDALLVREGEAGEVIQVGKQVDSGAIVYMVEFGTDKVIGCFESELMPLETTGATR
jgi:nitrogen fixation protein NifZ